YVQSAGVSGLRLSTDVLNDAFEKSSTLRRHLLGFVQAMMIQLSSSITAAGQTIEQRLARWLLMSQDRAFSDVFKLTQEFLAYMLGVRRVGVTVAAGELQRRHLISYERGVMTIVDRAGLERAACSCYASDLAVYTAQFGLPTPDALPA
ncbi:MAG: Crp/Fnr family transcriptional regulator, partial [Rhizobacter sp.]|nr:Crp/Fnr family transcriptional regulator [Rhizobacter sp.]